MCSTIHLRFTVSPGAGQPEASPARVVARASVKRCGCDAMVAFAGDFLAIEAEDVGGPDVWPDWASGVLACWELDRFPAATPR